MKNKIKYLKIFSYSIIILIIIFNCGKVYAYKEYKAGDSVEYNNETYHVIVDSTSCSDYITLLKDEPLNHDEIITYSGGELDLEKDIYNNRVVFSTQCDSLGISNRECKNIDYDNSIIKIIVDNWARKYNNDLKKIRNNKARIPEYDELLALTDYEISPHCSEPIEYIISENKIEWLTNASYWTMTPNDDNGYEYYVLKYDQYSNFHIFKGNEVIDNFEIKPVINLLKKAIGDTDSSCNADSNNNNNQFDPYNSYKIGDDIIYNNELYHVIENSDNNSNYVTLLKDKPLTISELDKYGRDIDGDLFINKEFNLKKSEPTEIRIFDDNIGGIQYFYSGCIHRNENGTFKFNDCYSDYNSSEVRRVVNNWSKDFQKDLVKVNGYRTRLITIDEYTKNDLYNWIESDKYTYWTMTQINQNNVNIIYNPNLLYNTWEKNAVRPVINLNKCAIEKDNPHCIYESSPQVKCSFEEKTSYKTFKVGDEVNYRGDKYYVIENSYENSDYVTLLKSELLNLDDVGEYKENILKNMSYNELDGSINYGCNNENSVIVSDDYVDLHDFNKDRTDYCIDDFRNTKIYNILNNWMHYELDEKDLVEVDKYKVRLLRIEDLTQKLGFVEGTSTNGSDEYTSYFSSENTPNIFIDIINKNSFMMDIYEQIKIFILNKDNYLNRLVASPDYISIKNSTIRPVINLKKEVLGSKTNYDIGEEVIYKDNKYIVIEESDNTKNYVVLLKEKVLNNGQLFSYSDENHPVFTPYYISDTCNSHSNTSGCSTSYEKSEIKKIIDYWSKDFQDDLVSVEGNKTRIISLYDLIYNLGYDKNLQFSTTYLYTKTEETPEWVYNKPSYCTMEPYEDSNSFVYINMYRGLLDVPSYKVDEEKIYYFASCSIRPVINLKKCAIDGGCTTVTKCSDTVESIVDVEKTLKNISKILLIVSGILMISGIIFIVYNYYVSHKEKK